MKEIIVDDKTAKRYKRKSIFAFVIFFVLIGLGWSGWIWLRHQPKNSGVQAPLRKVLDINEEVYSGLYSTKNLVKEYPIKKAAPKARVNGNIGMKDNFDPATWKLKIARATTGDTLYLTVDSLKRFRKTEVVFNFKCIEGWSQITWWGGVRFSDVMKYYGFTKETQMKFVGMKTPDEQYYVGIDMPSILHPQTILCYELNGRPLPMNQGYPVRLIIPVKYGVKHLKRIGTISFANEKPKDYWAEKGYDYYTGL
jgi:DMSO/TMAO reductase YedYZ molybdopterin-dependent catalytic subunit